MRKLQFSKKIRFAYIYTYYIYGCLHLNVQNCITKNALTQQVVPLQV